MLHRLKQVTQLSWSGEVKGGKEGGRVRISKAQAGASWVEWAGKVGSVVDGWRNGGGRLFG